MRGFIFTKATLTAKNMFQNTSGLCRVSRMADDEVKKYLKKIGSKGGKAKGKAKVRGGPDYYKKIVEKRWRDYYERKEKESKDSK